MIRPYDKPDQEHCIRIFREVGWMDGKDSDKEVFEAFISETNPLVAELNGEVEVFVVTRAGSCRYLAADIPFSAVTGVVTSRVARQQGLASSVTAQAIAESANNGAAMSMLGMFDQGYYEKFGYGSTTYYRISTFDPASLLVPRLTRSPKRLSKDDATAMHECRNRRRRYHGGCTLEGLGVKVTVDGVHVGFFGKDSSIKGVTIANPKELASEKNPNLLTIKEAHIEFSIFQLLDKEVVIPTTTVNGVVLYLQQNTGKSNIETVINNVSSDETPEGSHPEPPFNIETLTIRDITVIASGKFTVLDTRPVTAHIKEIVMHNIGSDGDAEVATEAITSAVTHAIMKHLADHPVEGLSKMAFSHVTGLINELPVFKQLGIGAALQGVTDTIGKGIDGVLGGIGELIGGGKKN